MAHRLEFLFSVFQAAFEVGNCSAGVFEIKTHILSGFLVFLELQPAIGPKGDFLGEPLMDGCKGLVNMGNAAPSDFLKMLWHERRGSKGKCPLFQISTDPGGNQQILEHLHFGGRQRFKVKVWRPTGEGGRAIRRDANELQPLG